MSEIIKPKPVRKIYRAKTYNTQTATSVFYDEGTDEYNYIDNLELLMNKHGVFFIVRRNQPKSLPNGDFYDDDEVEPITREKALQLMEIYAPHKIETLIGELPEDGENFVFFTFRMPDYLHTQIREIAKSKGVSLNSYMNYLVKQNIDLISK